MQSRKFVLTLDSFNSLSNICSFNHKKQIFHQKTNESQSKTDSIESFEPLQKRKKLQTEEKKAQQCQMTVKKRRMIRKNLNQNQKQRNKKKNQNRVVFKYFRRKMISQNSKSISRQKAQLIEIYDWLIQASATLYLSKDVFYLCISIIGNFISENFIEKNSIKIIESYVAAALSLSAKMDNNTINYPEAINKITEDRIKKEDIINAEIIIVKKLNFLLPIQSMLFEDLFKFCFQWDSYIKQKETSSVNLKLFKIGNHLNPEDWSPQSHNLFQIFVQIFDAIILLSQKFPLKRQRMNKPLSFALFTVVNHRINGNLPQNMEDKSEFIELFHEFLKIKLNFQEQQIPEWTNSFIKLSKQINLAQNIKKLSHSQKKQEIGALLNHQRQEYRSILGWT